jgi:hypothetical protein
VTEGIQIRVHDARTELVFDFDEIGISEWEYRVERKVIVPSAIRKQKIFSWNSQRIEAHLGGHMNLSSWRPHDPFFVSSSERCCCPEAENSRVLNMH